MDQLSGADTTRKVKKSEDWKHLEVIHVIPFIIPMTVVIPSIIPMIPIIPLSTLSLS